jgi:hypothetical protein
MDIQAKITRVVVSKIVFLGMGFSVFVDAVLPNAVKQIAFIGSTIL